MVQASVSLLCGAGISEPLAVAAALHSPAAGDHFNHCAAVDTMVSALLNCPRGKHVPAGTCSQ